MLKYARIITDDARFARMIAIELSQIGISVITDESAVGKSQEEYVIYTVADLDFCFSEDVTEFATKSTVIGFSHSYADKIADKSQKCSFFFHRPFLISEFLSVFGEIDRGVVRRKSRVHAQKRISSSFEKGKKSYLTVDPSTQSAVFGEIRIPLSENEYQVLSLLCEKRGDVVSRDDISALLGVRESNMCDVYICHLRRKIDNRLGLKLICTVRGNGYILKN